MQGFRINCKACGFAVKEQFIVNGLCAGCREKIQRGLSVPKISDVS